MMEKEEKRYKRSHTSKKRKNKLDTSKSRCISLDLDLRLGLIPLTASPPQIHPAHLSLTMSISNLSILDLTAKMKIYMWKINIL